MKCKKCPGWEECVLREGDQCVKDPKKYLIFESGRFSGKNAYADTILEITEKALKALKIISEKDINVFWLKKSPNVSRYNLAVGTERKLKKAEYDLLKELLKEVLL